MSKLAKMDEDSQKNDNISINTSNIIVRYNIFTQHNNICNLFTILFKFTKKIFTIIRFQIPISSK